MHGVVGLKRNHLKLEKFHQSSNSFHGAAPTVPRNRVVWKQICQVKKQPVQYQAHAGSLKSPSSLFGLALWVSNCTPCPPPFFPTPSRPTPSAPKSVLAIYLCLSESLLLGKAVESSNRYNNQSGLLLFQSVVFNISYFPPKKEMINIIYYMYT